MNIARLALPLVSVLFFNVHAADSAGNFAIKGAGLLNCKTFTKAREDRTRTYYLIGGWIDGFISAHNKYVGDTYDVTTFETSELLANIIDHHCKENPGDLLYPVINSVVSSLAPERITELESKVVVIAGEQQGRIYRETLRRTQRALKRLGHFSGPVSGDFDQATEEAIKSYQVSINFDPTGYPDQATLWRLLRK